MKLFSSNVRCLGGTVIGINIYADIQPCRSSSGHILGKPLVLGQPSRIMGPARTDDYKINARRFDLLPVYRAVDVCHINTVLHHIFSFA